jgi:hypothetical protein
MAQNFAQMRNLFWGCDQRLCFGAKFRQNAKSVLGL